MSAYLIDWLSLLGRWVHLITGIAWIGASFYFVWLDNHLLAPARKDAPDTDANAGVGGELWAVHGGGFYHSQKYRVAPDKLPSTLHWFYWEAYSTFLSGFFLLCLLYYARAEMYLIDPAVAALSKPQAIGISLGFLVASWLTYDFLCRSPLARNDRALGIVVAVLLAVEAWALCQLFSGRGAFIQFGAALGTIMVANVFFVIIPGQRELVRAKQENRVPDPIHGQRGKQRSVHNTYFTLPVLFTMISHHYAMTYGARYNWLVLIGLCIAGALIRAWFVARHKAHERGGRTSLVPAALGVLTLAAVAFALAPASGTQAVPMAAPQLPGNTSGSAVAAQSLTTEFERVRAILKLRCQPCHSATPTQPGFVAPPNGIVLDTQEHIFAQLPQTQQQLSTRAMPIGNLTGMTEEERSTVLAWIDHGAPR